MISFFDACVNATRVFAETIHQTFSIIAKLASLGTSTECMMTGVTTFIIIVTMTITIIVMQSRDVSDKQQSKKYDDKSHRCRGQNRTARAEVMSLSRVPTLPAASQSGFEPEITV
jgi:hypothetical protein